MLNNVVIYIFYVWYYYGLLQSSGVKASSIAYVSTYNQRTSKTLPVLNCKVNYLVN